jgi:hypothetical protein
MEARALGLHEDGAHAVGCPAAQIGEGHYLKTGGQTDRSGETDVSYLGGVSHFDHLLAPTYPSGIDAVA